MSSEHEVARRFMARKGYPDARPDRVVASGLRQWTFEYDIEGALLVLDVSYQDGQWSAFVFDYVAA